MTTTDAVAAWLNGCGRPRARLVFRLCAIFTAATLAGCGSSSLLGSSDEPTASASPAILPIQQPAASQRRVAVAPIMGAPDSVSKEVGSQLGSSLERQRVGLAKGGETSDYTLRGYMVATRERAGTKVAYIFDLTDPAGKRVNRIQGEEMSDGGDAKNPWASVTPDLAKRITDKTATSLASALSSLGPTVSGAAPPVGVGASSASGGPIAPPSNVVQPSPETLPTAQTTGSIDRTAALGSSTAAIVPAVVGAPGDGNTALSAAMRQELQTAGIGNAGPGQRAYLVAGKVSVGAPKDGKQSIKIDWRVTDPAGGLLATVSQNNDIQAGALEGAWGAIADEAAQGAAAKIKALIEESNASSATASGAGRAKAGPRSKT